MDIAIVAPSSVPFTVGGAEGLWWGLQDFINLETADNAELIKLPSPEAAFWDLMASYRAFSELNLDHFDLVISTKYPAWMVAHGRHVCYMQHKLRGLYDTYHLTGLPAELGAAPKELELLRKFMKMHPADRDRLPEFFDKLFALREDSRCDAALTFPGPMAREIVHYLDGIALSQSAIVKYMAISNNVAKRRHYFPEGAKVAACYHPSKLKGFRSGPYDYLLAVSRLDSPKRIALIVNAMKYVQADIKLKIAGSGPQLNQLRDLAGSDERIEFLGFVNDGELVELYANARAVVFVPYDEDYGLITVEAMASAKPVVTVTDSGGPLEFVEHEVNGLVAEPSADALGQCLAQLAESPQLAREMGRRAWQSVAHIAWQPLIDAIIDGPSRGLASTARSKRRQKMVVAVTFPVYPPRGGGQVRVFNLYRELAHYRDIVLVTFAPHGQPPLDQEIAPHLRELRIPASRDHQTAEAAWSAKVGWVPVTDVTMPLLWQLTHEYRDALFEVGANADIAVACHPYLCTAVASLGRPELWYEAQDVEYSLKKQIMPENEAGVRLLKTVAEIERECWASADVTLTCTQEDAEELKALYGPSAGTVAVVPNGATFHNSPILDETDRNALRVRLGLEERYIALFMGSWHGPNLNACHHLLEIAEKAPNVSFLLMGSVCNAITEKRIPENVTLLGCLGELEKNLVLAASDIALNPMDSGSGSNLKMLDYLAAGLPVITTPFGRRGLELPQGAAITVELTEFAQSVVESASRIDLLRASARDNRPGLIKRYAWENIARNLMRQLHPRDRTLSETHETAI